MSDAVYGEAVRTKMLPAYQHILCEVFAQEFPGSRDFLMQKLQDKNPQIAAYAFKCLVLVAELQLEDIPESVRTRKDVIQECGVGCKVRETKLGTFIADYFGSTDEEDEDPVA
jgi:hypothetical protein